MGEDRFTNTVEDAARFEERRNAGWPDEDRPSLAELAESYEKPGTPMAHPDEADMSNISGGSS